MDLESGDIIYVESESGVRVLLRLERPPIKLMLTTRLTTEEARTLANALLAAIIEAEAHA
jgi:hypothetical protein